MRDTIKGLLMVLYPFLIPTFGLLSWACVPIISNPINHNFLFSLSLNSSLSRMTKFQIISLFSSLLILFIYFFVGNDGVGKVIEIRVEEEIGK